MKNLLQKIFILGASITLGGCMVGPDYDSPDKTMGAELLDFPDFTRAGTNWKQANPADIFMRGKWWNVFADSQLDSLLEKCRAENPDLKSLYYKVEQARENACMTRAQLFPHLNGNATYMRLQQSDYGILPSRGVFDDWITGAAITWDADLFGRVRSMLNSDRASAESLRDEYENMLLLLQSQTAKAYFTLCELTQQTRILEKTAEMRKGETAFIRNRVEMGTAGESDLQRALQEEHSTLDQLAQTRTAVALAGNMLSYLAGTTPSKLKFTGAEFPSRLPQIPSTIRSTLLERRPDIAAAERRVCAANYKIGAAQAAFFPTVTVTSAVGVDSTAFSKLMEAGTFSWGVSPQIYIPIFQAGRLLAQKRVALAKHKQVIEEYRGVVLKAVKEVEDSLAVAEFLAERQYQRAAAAEAARRLETLTQQQYEGGVVDYFSASQAHRFALINELECAKIRGERFRNCVDLIKALGGGWTKPKLR